MPKFHGLGAVMSLYAAIGLCGLVLLLSLLTATLSKTWRSAALGSSIGAAAVTPTLIVMLADLSGYPGSSWVTATLHLSGGEVDVFGAVFALGMLTVGCALARLATALLNRRSRQTYQTTSSSHSVSR